MGRNKEQTVEPCSCECDCPADVLEAGQKGHEVQAVADRAGMLAVAANRGMEKLNAATNRASDALGMASSRLEEVSKRMGKQMNGHNGRMKPIEMLGMGAALASMADRARHRESKPASRLADVRSSAADTLHDVASTASDRFDDLRSMASDRFEDLSKALPHRRKPSIWERLAVAGMAASLAKQLNEGLNELGDTINSATRQTKRRRFMAMDRLGAMMDKRKAEKQANRAFALFRRQMQPRRRVSPLAWGLAFGAGAGLMYFFDPQMGGRRRALVRDQFVHYRHELMDRFSGAREDMQYRAQGMVAEAHRYTREEQPSNRVLEERVRAQLGFLSSHPSSIEITANDGVVTLRGPILAAEMEPLLTRVRLIPGVTSVDNRLEVYQQAGDIPGLQGGATRENM